tara:strand:+ start:738 stop:1034 length:297 start_codon:yes stop_codon:yes gene_type:complete
MEYKNYNAAGPHDLIAAGGQTGGKISRVFISNNSANPAVVSLYLSGVSPSVDYYFFKAHKIPPYTSMVFSDCLAFDYVKYSLKLINSGTSPDLTVMIK